MATDASGGCTGVSVGMALGAGYGRVSPAQWECSFVMVKVSRLPGGFGMAGSAVGGESGSLMVRVGGGIVVALMAADAGGWCAAVTVGVTLSTGDGSMCTA